MAIASDSTVIFLHSHPTWMAAQQRECQRQEDMRRHPSFLTDQHAAGLEPNVAAGACDCTVWPGADAPA